MLGLGLGLTLLSGCSDKASRTASAGGLETLEFRYQGSPGLVTPLELAEDLGYLAPIKLNYLGISTGGPQGIQTVLSGDADISSLAFTGAVVKVVASKAPVKAVIAGYATFADSIGGYYVLQDSPIRTARDLIGKKVAVNTMGAQMEFMLTEYLRRSGLTPEEIRQVTLVVLPPGSGEQALRQKQVDLAVLYGPALDRGGVRLLFRDFDLVGELTTGAYVMANRFLKEKPNTARHVIAAIAKAYAWEQKTPRDEMLQRYRQILARRGRNENDALLRYWYGSGVSSPGGSFKDSDFQIWIDWLVRDGQLKAGEVDPKRVYSNEFNPYAAL